MALNAYIAVTGLLPVRRRLALTSLLVRRLAAPALGWYDRVADNLDFVWPDTPAKRKREIAERAIDNLARALIENYDPAEMLARGAAYPVTGPGLPVLEEARASGHPVLLITGHYGSPICARAALVARGYTVAGLLRPMSNPFMNARYIRNYREVGEPVFEQGRRGTIGLIRHIREGGIAAVAFDVFESSGTLIPFLGQPAPTALSFADIALKTDALLIPYFGIRRPDGFGFDAVIEDPVPHGDPLEMMTEVTRRLEVRIEADPGQWMWTHRRWKPKRVAKYREE
ncbi:lysophospholipid acyltransferase family protein [Sagittula sp. M10.9X]|uniref:Lysophospholipid acyltransferase family protein n=2 Tax=Sagittula salina TaxID=2820268 RepID=A0A940MPJ2_9RHOB|nr:lysophospholipid acyltransferase family protein [Sagittula salina]MBP0481782.1 lysophospholipid acyltransferase family protein [Sagittula salina]